MVRVNKFSGKEWDFYDLKMLREIKLPELVHFLIQNIEYLQEEQGVDGFAITYLNELERIVMGKLSEERTQKQMIERVKKHCSGCGVFKDKITPGLERFVEGAKTE